MNFVTDGRFLGGFIGNRSQVVAYVKGKIEHWIEYVLKFSSVAKAQPQAAYAAVSKSLQFEWFFIQRVIPHCGDYFSEFRNSINYTFLPSLFGEPLNDSELSIFSLLARLGGMGICDPVFFGLSNLDKVLIT